jgi:hypothetical protein
VEVEWLILADAAQVIGNKLYLLGGGWDRLNAPRGLPIQQHISIAVSVKVAWNETNQRHDLEVEVLGEDVKTEEPKSLVKVNGQFEVGRPPGITVGQDQRIQLAIDVMLTIDSPGTKTAVARIDGVECKQVEFVVIAAKPA